MSHLILAVANSHAKAKSLADSLRERSTDGIFVVAEGNETSDLPHFEGLHMVNRPGTARLSQGAFTGSAIGGVAAASTIAIPFAGPFVFVLTAPFAMAAGAMMGGAAASGAPGKEASEQSVASTLRNKGIPESEIGRFETAVQNGLYVVGVYCREDQIPAIEQAMESWGAENINDFPPPEPGGDPRDPVKP